MKYYIITSAISIIIGVSGVLGYQHFTAQKIEKSTKVIHLAGDKNKIKHTGIKNKKDVLEIITKSTGNETIKTIIKKSDFCPKQRKNIILVGVNPFYQTHDMYLGYNLNYQRIIINRFVVGAGINVNQNLFKSRVEGIGGKISLGIMF